MCMRAKHGGEAMTDWTSIRVRESTLEELKVEEDCDESHDDLLSRLLDAVEE